MNKQYPINTPDLWRDKWPVKDTNSHKYTNGHALIYGAPALTGATRLAASAAARTGAGLVTVLCSKKTADIYRTSLPAHILVRDNLKWMDLRVTALLYGPGGLPVKPDWKTALPTVLDADALSIPLQKRTSNFILTPHEGEFAKAFPGLTGSNAEKAQKAAQSVNAHIVLKGPQTVIAAPDGRLVINTHASSALATAGTGDVLAGIITGLIARNMPLFEACCAATWLHGECALQFGPGLVADDLPDLIPQAVKSLKP